ncbi:MAG: alanine racemase [Aminivibrio sp.]|jgi:predicted amino acid racemase
MALTWPLLRVDQAAVEENTRRTVEKCATAGIKVWGVTKGMAAREGIARAMTRGGAEGLADSRVKNLAKLKAMKTGLPLALLRIPMQSELSDVVEYADCSLASAPVTILGLEKACAAAGRTHEVILMIDLGDLREGVWFEDREAMGRIADVLKGCSRVRCTGVGVNFGCFGGTLPTREKLLRLEDMGRELGRETGHPVETVSGGATSSLILLEEGTMPPGVNNLRIGEGILLGIDVTHSRAVPWLKQRAMVLEAEVVEVARKPSVPRGPAGSDAFGGKPVFEDRGPRLRAIAAIGRQDVRVEGLTPELEGVCILGASSDHMILDVEDCRLPPAPGDKLRFFPDYGAMLALATSPYVSFKMV